MSDFQREREINGNETKRMKLKREKKGITRAFDDANTPQFCIFTLHTSRQCKWNWKVYICEQKERSEEENTSQHRLILCLLLHVCVCDCVKKIFSRKFNTFCGKQINGKMCERCFMNLNSFHLLFASNIWCSFLFFLAFDGERDKMSTTSGWKCFKLNHITFDWANKKKI